MLLESILIITTVIWFVLESSGYAIGDAYVTICMFVIFDVLAAVFLKLSHIILARFLQF